MPLPYNLPTRPADEIQSEVRYIPADDPRVANLREYHEAHPYHPEEKPREQRADPNANITKALIARNEARSKDLHERTVRGLELYNGGMAIEDVAKEVGLIPRKLKERWKKLLGQQL